MRLVSKQKYVVLLPLWERASIYAYMPWQNSAGETEAKESIHGLLVGLALVRLASDVVGNGDRDVTESRRLSGTPSAGRIRRLRGHRTDG